MKKTFSFLLLAISFLAPYCSAMEQNQRPQFADKEEEANFYKLGVIAAKMNVDCIAVAHSKAAIFTIDTTKEEILSSVMNSAMKAAHNYMEDYTQIQSHLCSKMKEYITTKIQILRNKYFDRPEITSLRDLLSNINAYCSEVTDLYYPDKSLDVASNKQEEVDTRSYEEKCAEELERQT